MSYGVTSTGFVAKTLSDIKAELEADFKVAFGVNIDLSASAPNGQFIGIFSERFAELWEVGQALWAAFDPDQAADAAQEAICAITGTMREAAKKSTVTETCTGTNGTALPAGRVVSGGGGVKFQSLALATLVTAVAWATGTTYAVGDKRKATTAGTTRIYLCTVGGTSAGAGTGPSGTGTAITDNTVTWRYLGEGAAYADVPMEALETGPKSALAFSLTTIETPVAGWSSCTNTLDAKVGSDIETNTALRLRRESELAAAGLATHDAIKAKVTKDLKALGVNPTVIVFSNYTDVTDGNGVPPHSVEVLVLGGTDQQVLNAVFAAVGEGIRPYGSTSGTVTDASGIAQTIAFSRPTTKNIYATFNVTKDPATFPSDGDTQIKNAVKAFGDTYAIGRDVTASALQARVFAIAGVLDVTATFIGTAPAPATSTTIVNTARELALFDTSRMVVNLSDGTP